MVSSDGFSSMSQVFGGLSCPLLQCMSFPIHHIPQFPPCDPRIQYFLNFIFQSSFYNLGQFGNQLTSPLNRVHMVRVQKHNVKDIVNSPLRGQLELECRLTLTDDLQNLER